MNTTRATSRARSKEMKDAKREELIRAAERLFENLEITEISLQVLAEEAGFTASNIYRYFDQQDDVFLEVLNVKMARCLNDLEVRLRYVDVSLSIDQKLEMVIEIFVSTIQAHTVFGKLLSLYGARLEESSSVDAVVRHKTIAMELLSKIMDCLSVVFQKAEPERLRYFMVCFHSFVAGFWAFAHPGETSRKVHEMEEFSGLLPDGNRTLEHVCRLMLADAIRETKV